MGVLPDNIYSRNTASYPEQVVSPSPRERFVVHLQKTVVLHPRGTDPLRLQMLAALRLQILTVLRLQMLVPFRPKKV